jgi:hypothetical protein
LQRLGGQKIGTKILLHSAPDPARPTARIWNAVQQADGFADI